MSASRWSAWRWRIATVIAFLLVSAPAAEGQRTLLVHLPSAPVEAANQQAEAINSLAAVLSQGLPDRDLEPKFLLALAERSFLDGLSGVYAPSG